MYYVLCDIHHITDLLLLFNIKYRLYTIPYILCLLYYTTSSFTLYTIHDTSYTIYMLYSVYYTSSIIHIALYLLRYISYIKCQELKCYI